MDVVTVIRDQAERTSKLVGGVRPDQLGLPTPCAGWDVRTLINHLCLGSEWVARVARGERAEPDYETDFVGDDPAGAYERWKAEMVETCSVPGLSERTVHIGPLGDAPGAVVLALALMESVVHRLDLARAVDADPDIAPEVAEMVLEQVGPLMTDEFRAPSAEETTGSIPFGPPVEVPDDAPPMDRLLAFLGRTP